MERTVKLFILLALILGTHFNDALAITPKKILILRPWSQEFEDIVKIIKMEDEEGEYQITEVQVDMTHQDPKIVSDAMARVKPDFVITMDNTALENYRFWQSRNPQAKPFPLNIVCLASFVSEEIKGMENVVAIPYELPMSVTLTKLRGKLKQNKKISKVGLLYRERFQAYIDLQKERCAAEGIELVAIPVKEGDKKFIGRQVKNGLRTLIRKEKVQAVWMLNDNILINDHIRIWSEGISPTKTWFIHGVETLINQGIGNFAVTPDLADIGSQVSDWLYQYRTPLTEPRIQELHSEITYLHEKYSKKLGFDAEYRDQIDFLITPK